MRALLPITVTLVLAFPPTVASADDLPGSGADLDLFLATASDDRLDDTLIGAGAGLEWRGERFYLRGLAERMERDAAESARGQLGVGLRAPWQPNVELVGELGARYLDSNWPAEWGDDGADVAVEFGVRGAGPNLQTDLRAVVLTPTDSDTNNAQAGARLEITLLGEDLPYGLLLAGEWLSDEASARVGLRRRF